MKRTMRMHARSHRRRRPSLDAMEERSLLSALSGVLARDAIPMEDHSLLSALSGVLARDAISVAPAPLASSHQAVASRVADPDETTVVAPIGSAPITVDPDETISSPPAPVSSRAFDALASQSGIPVPPLGQSGASLGEFDDPPISPQREPSETLTVLDPPGDPRIRVGPLASVGVSRLLVGDVDRALVSRSAHGLTLDAPGMERQLPPLFPPPHGRFSVDQSPRRAGPITGFLPLGGSDLAKAVERFLGPLEGEVAGNGRPQGPALSKWLLVVVVAALEWLRRTPGRQEAFVRGPASPTSSHGFPELLGLRTAELP